MVGFRDLTDIRNRATQFFTFVVLQYAVDFHCLFSYYLIQIVRLIDKLNYRNSIDVLCPG